jgi:hypothetical protein
VALLSHANMTIAKESEIKAALRVEFESTRSSFLTLLNSLSDEDLRKKSLNSGWTNGEILFHMTFAFMILNSLIPLVRFWGRLPESYSKIFARILNAFTGPFNWVNAIGARTGGRIYRGKRIGKKFDRVYFSLLKRLNSVREAEWRRGMYYPTRWDALFKQYMTLEDVFHYPVVHFKFHLKQLSD